MEVGCLMMQCHRREGKIKFFLLSVFSSSMSPSATPWNNATTPGYGVEWSPMGNAMTPGVAFSPAGGGSDSGFSPAYR